MSNVGGTSARLASPHGLKIIPSRCVRPAKNAMELRVFFGGNHSTVVPLLTEGWTRGPSNDGIMHNGSGLPNTVLVVHGTLSGKHFPLTTGH